MNLSEGTIAACVSQPVNPWSKWYLFGSIAVMKDKVECLRDDGPARNCRFPKVITNEANAAVIQELVGGSGSPRMPMGYSYVCACT